ncbi:hypothetical protein BH23GEM6_BH23GEM6_08920 [soil metagenome]
MSASVRFWLVVRCLWEEPIGGGTRTVGDGGCQFVPESPTLAKPARAMAPSPPFSGSYRSIQRVRQLENRNALGNVLIGGLASSTSPVLTVTPAHYLLVERRPGRRRLARRVSRFLDKEPIK